MSSIPVRNFRGLKIGDRFTFAFRRSVNGTYSSFTGQTFLAQLRAIDGTLKGTGTVSLSTNTETDDTVTVNFPAAVTELLDPGTYTYEVEWTDDETTMQTGKATFTKDLSYT